MKRLAKIRLEALSFTGVDGSVNIFGTYENRFPVHGDNCNVISTEIPEKNGLYKIVEVETSFGVDIGLRHKLGLGLKVN